MVRYRRATLALFAAALSLFAPRVGETAVGDVVLYSLSAPPSALDVGCQAPCECPIVTHPTYGSFELVADGADPLYSYYEVRNYIASFNDGPGAVTITGSGRYRIGGEVALVQQLTLDLQVEGGPTQHFDSGLTAVGAVFPQIDVACSVHGFFCFDSVLVVDAKPIEATGTPPPRLPRAGIETVRPNPFSRSTAVAISLDGAGPVDLTVLDLAGRRVRRLASPPLTGGGIATVVWDGLGDDGRAAPAGVYWLSMRWRGGMDTRRLVKLE